MNLLQRNDIHPPRRFTRLPRQAPQLKVYVSERWSFTRAGEESARAGKDFSISFAAALQRVMREFPSIAMDQDVIAGTPRIRDTRIPVHLVIESVKYYGVEGAIESFPSLTVELVKEVLSFAARLLEHRLEYEAETSAG